MSNAALKSPYLMSPAAARKFYQKELDRSHRGKNVICSVQRLHKGDLVVFYRTYEVLNNTITNEQRVAYFNCDGFKDWDMIAG